jgi:hypothetical protein
MRIYPPLLYVGARPPAVVSVDDLVGHEFVMSSLFRLLPTRSNKGVVPGVWACAWQYFEGAREADRPKY